MLNVLNLFWGSLLVFKSKIFFVRDAEAGISNNKNPKKKLYKKKRGERRL